MNVTPPASLNLPIERGLSPTQPATTASTTVIPEAPSSMALLALQQDVQGHAIQSAATSNSSSSKASMLNKMTRHLNMV